MSPAALEFQNAIRQELKLLQTHLAPPVAALDPEKAQEALKGLFQLAIRKGNPLMYGVALLDQGGVVLTVRYPVQDHPEGVADSEKAHNYSNLTAVRDSLRKGLTRQSVVYVQQNYRYIVCHPLVYLGKRVGVLILGFYPPLLEDKLGISREEFLALDLAPR